MELQESRAVYCCYCLGDVCRVRSLATGRCRHAFCGQCISALEDCEVVTCPYDLSAMLVGQIRPNLQLMRMVNQLERLKEGSDDSGDIRKCCLEMRECVNIQGVPCKSAVMDQCVQGNSCPYSHSETLIRRTRDIVQGMEARDSKTEEIAEKQCPQQAILQSCWPIRCLQFLLETVLLTCLLVSLQATLCGLVVTWVLIEAILKVLRAHGGVLMGCVRFPLLIWSWSLLHSVLFLRSLLLRLSKAMNSPPPRLPTRLRSLLTPVISTHLT